MSLREFPQKVASEFLNRVADMYEWELTPPPAYSLHVLNVDDTLDLLLEKPKSFCRYGDGEVNFMQGRGCGHQEYDENLARRLKEILQSSDDKCYVAIDGNYFNIPKHDISKRSLEYMRKIGYDMRNEFLRYCNKRRLYIQSTLTCNYMTSDLSMNYYENFYDKIKLLFKDRNLVIFSGKTVFDKINYNVFEYAKSRRHIFAESRHAWRQYKEILEVARKFPKDEVTLCFILGQAATVIAWDLAQEGYMAWDIGHLAKDYDAFKKNNKHTNTTFFAPD